MTKLKIIPLPDRNKTNAKEVLLEAIDQAPDSVIVMCFWEDKENFTIKTSHIVSRLTMLGALEDVKNKVLTDGVIHE